MLLKKNTNRGLIRTIIIFFLILVVLAYFGFNLKEIIASQAFQDNWQFVKDAAIWVWENILKIPVRFVWDSIIVPLIWDPIIDNISNR